MVHEIPASITLTNITRHMVTRDYGVAIGTTRSGTFGVATIARIEGMGLTYIVKSTHKEEAVARSVANKMWTAAKAV